MKLFKKPNSKFYWYDFTVQGHRYRGSKQETRSVRALKTASLKLVSVIENTDLLPSRPTALGRFAERFLTWVDDGRLEEKNQEVLPKWLAAAEGDTRVRYATRPDYQRFCRAVEISWLCRECQLRFADIATNASQSRGVENDRPRS